MPITTDKIIACKIYGDVSIKDNCVFCHVKTKDLFFKENFSYCDELIFFYCQYFNNVISVEVI